MTNKSFSVFLILKSKIQLSSLVKFIMSTRDELYAEINSTRDDFHKLLASIPAEAYNLPSDNPAWTVSEVLYHMSIAPRMLGKDVKMITGQKWIYRLLPIILPKKAFDWMNKILTKCGARNSTPEFLAQEYDKAHKATIEALAKVDDADFQMKLFYPDWDPLLSGEVTLEKLFHYVRAHFVAHAEQLWRVVKSGQAI